MTDLPRNAVDLVALGYLVHPLKPGTKTPKLSGWQRLATTCSEQVERWWSDDPEANLGIRVADDETFVDIDSADTFDAFRERCSVDTTTSRTPRGGWHLRYRGRARNRVLIIRGDERLLEVKAAKSNIVGVGSIFDGRTYRWERPPWEVEPAEIPNELVAWIAEAKSEPKANRNQPCHHPGAIIEGIRNVTLMEKAGAMWRYDMDRAAIEAALLIHNRRHCRPPLPDDEVRRIADSTSRLPTPPPWVNPWVHAERIGTAYGLGVAERAVLAKLCEHARDNGLVTRGERSIAAATGMSRTTVRKAVQTLEAVDVLRIAGRTRRFGTTYELARIDVDLLGKHHGGGPSGPDLYHPVPSQTPTETRELSQAGFDGDLEAGMICPGGSRGSVDAPSTEVPAGVVGSRRPPGV
jgi:bifunctional DNA primase/polymerase-like protein/primase-like protein